MWGNPLRCGAMRKHKDTAPAEKSPTATITFRLKADLARLIVRAKQRRGTTASWIINRALASYFSVKGNA